MRRKPFSPVSLLLGVLLWTTVWGQLAVAQSVVRLSASPDLTAAVGDLLREGRRLETERRWGEALSHYEDAVRQYPRERTLQSRFDLARAHYDLGRRYSDRSFLRTVAALSLGETLDLYSEVLLKIQAHYVASPNWKELVECGTNGFEVALSESVFIQFHASDVDERTLDKFRGELRRAIGALVIRTRSDARDAVSMAAGIASRRLGVPAGAVALEYTCGATNSLDLYSAYLTPDQLSEVYAQIEGNFVGLGVELKADAGALLIVRVMPASPAQRAGILTGDRIVAVDGRATYDLSTSQAANMLHGEEGSVAELIVETPGSRPRELAIRRDHVDVPSIGGSRIVDAGRGIGYIKLTCFQKTTPRDLDAALWSLHRQGMKSLILDLRGNPGGLLVTAVDVVDKFVDEGIIVSTRGRTLQEDFTYSARPAGTWHVPLVVLIDRESASAAEIFAGAIRDHRRGTIVGTQSFGKGSVQGIFPLNTSRAGVRLTTAKFYSPSGHPFSGVGVEPHLAVRQAARPVHDSVAALTGDEDPVLAAGMQAARQLTATSL